MSRKEGQRHGHGGPSSRVEGLHTLLLAEVADLLGCKRSEVRRRLRELAPHLEGHIRSCRGSRVVVTDTGLLALQRVRELEELCFSPEEIVERLRAELLGKAADRRGTDGAESAPKTTIDPAPPDAERLPQQAEAAAGDEAGGDRLRQALRTLEDELAQLGAQLRPGQGPGPSQTLETEEEVEAGADPEIERTLALEEEEPALRPSEAASSPSVSTGVVAHISGWERRAARAVLAGFGATGAMTLGVLLGPAMGLPPMDVPGMLAGFLGRTLGPAFGSVTVGWALHFGIGIVLALGYAAVAPGIPGPAAVRGALYGLLPFLIAQLLVMPIMGMGLFASAAPNPPMVVLGSLVGHLVYGAVLGALYGRLGRLHGRPEPQTEAPPKIRSLAVR